MFSPPRILYAATTIHGETPLYCFLSFGFFFAAGSTTVTPELVVQRAAAIAVQSTPSAVSIVAHRHFTPSSSPRRMVSPHLLFFLKQRRDNMRWSYLGRTNNQFPSIRIFHIYTNAKG
jgi:hypothetical protein